VPSQSTQQISRSVTFGKDSRISPTVLGGAHSGRALLSVYSDVSNVQIGVCLSTDQLAELRDAITAVLFEASE
jgi:hypothetical protein